MKTASHYTFSGPGRVCISRGAPRGAPGGYKMFKALAPTRDILGIEDQDEYRRRYRAEVLDVLDAKQTWHDLHKLTGGAEPVLQCFERPPFTSTNWCHRRMVADWFAETIGEKVDEVTPETPEQKRDAAKAKLAASSTIPPTGFESTSRIPYRAAVEAVRSEIDGFWHKICAMLGIERNWSWMGLPDRVRDDLDSDDYAEWVALQARYRQVDV